jgi:hypothetical protein
LSKRLSDAASHTNFEVALSNTNSYLFINSSPGVGIPPCRVTIPLDLTSIFLDLPELGIRDDGVEFVPAFPGDGYYHKQTKRTAAIPSRLAERLTEIALEPQNKNVEDLAVKKYLEENWHIHGTLFDLTLEEESSILAGKHKRANYPLADIFRQDRSQMPKIFKYWAPLNTQIIVNSSGTAIFFKDDKWNDLIRVWVSHEEEP